MDSYDVVVIGGGPGGYTAAIRAAQLGLRTALVEQSELGGVCLNFGCIPTKALLFNAGLVNLVKQAKEFGIAFDDLQYHYAPAFERSRRVVGRLLKGVQALMKKNGIEVYQGSGYLSAPQRVQVRPNGPDLETKNVILATGGRPRALPGIPFQQPEVLSCREAVLLQEVPKSLLIVGAGPIGMEFGYLFRTYDCEVTLVEILPRVLPLEEPEISEAVARAFVKRGVRIHTESRLVSLEVGNGGVSARIAGPKGETSLCVERVLVAVGVQGNIEGIGLETLGVRTEGHFICVDDRMATNVPGIYAVGDVTGKMPLAHVAAAQGVVAAEAIAGQAPSPLRYEDMPRAVYCQPQVASVGLSEAQARERGHEVKTGTFPFRANGKALAQHDWDGFVKVVMDAKTGTLLGAHLVGPEVTELLPEIGLARTLQATAEQVALTVHAHPTLSEALHEAVLAALGRPLNF